MPIARITRSAGSIGKASAARRRSHRLHRASRRLAPEIRTDPRPPLARRAAARRKLWRIVADAVRGRDDRAGLEFSRRPLPLLCAWTDAGWAAADLHRAQRVPRGDRVHAAEARRVQDLAAGSE